MSKINKLIVYKKNAVETALKMNFQAGRLDQYRTKIFKPSFTNLFIHKDNYIINLLLFLSSLGKYRIFYVFDDEIIIHYSYIIPKIYRFPFMKKHDLQIGPCFTSNNYRGKGIYTKVLQILPEIFEISYNCDYWIYTSESNIASKKAIARSGFHYFGDAFRTTLIRKITIHSFNDND